MVVVVQLLMVVEEWATTESEVSEDCQALDQAEA